MYTRHHDGFIREKYVQRLKQEQAKTDWVLLYLIELTGEYVREILERIEPMLQTWSEEQLRTFAAANDRYLQRIERRIISYWDLHQRTDLSGVMEFRLCRLSDCSVLSHVSCSFLKKTADLR